LEGRADYSRDLVVDGRIILKRISNEKCVGMWTGFICLRVGYKGERALVNTVLL
jgi:hypothetical protein